MKKEDTTEIDLGELCGFWLRKFVFILIFVIAGGIIGFLISAVFITPTYQSTTSVYIMNKQNEDTLTYSDTQLASVLSKDYEELVTSRTVIEKTIDDLDLDTTYEKLSKQVDVSNVSDTRIIKIVVTDTDPARAQLIASTLRDNAAEHIIDVMDIEAVNIVDDANYPEKKAAPSNSKNAIIGAVIGLVVILIILTIIFVTDDTIKSSEDIEKYLGMTTLGTIPKMEGSSDKTKKTSSGGSSPKKESYSRDYDKYDNVKKEKQPQAKSDRPQARPQMDAKTVVKQQPQTQQKVQAEKTDSSAYDPELDEMFKILDSKEINRKNY